MTDTLGDRLPSPPRPRGWSRARPGGPAALVVTLTCALLASTSCRLLTTPGSPPCRDDENCPESFVCIEATCTALLGGDGDGDGDGDPGDGDGDGDPGDGDGDGDPGDGDGDGDGDAGVPFVHLLDEVALLPGAEALQVGLETFGLPANPSFSFVTDELSPPPVTLHVSEEPPGVYILVASLDVTWAQPDDERDTPFAYALRVHDADGDPAAAPVVTEPFTLTALDERGGYVDGEAGTSWVNEVGQRCGAPARPCIGLLDALASLAHLEASGAPYEAALRVATGTQELASTLVLDGIDLICGLDPPSWEAGEDTSLLQVYATTAVQTTGAVTLEGCVVQALPAGGVASGEGVRVADGTLTLKDSTVRAPTNALTSTGIFLVGATASLTGEGSIVEGGGGDVSVGIKASFSGNVVSLSDCQIRGAPDEGGGSILATGIDLNGAASLVGTEVTGGPAVTTFGVRLYGAGSLYLDEVAIAGGTPPDLGEAAGLFADGAASVTAVNSSFLGVIRSDSGYVGTAAGVRLEQGPSFVLTGEVGSPLDPPSLASEISSGDGFTATGLLAVDASHVQLSGVRVVASGEDDTTAAFLENVGTVELTSSHFTATASMATSVDTLRIDNSCGANGSTCFLVGSVVEGAAANNSRALLLGYSAAPQGRFYIVGNALKVPLGAASAVGLGVDGGAGGSVYVLGNLIDVREASFGSRAIRLTAKGNADNLVGPVEGNVLAINRNANLAAAVSEGCLAGVTNTPTTFQHNVVWPAAGAKYVEVARPPAPGAPCDVATYGSADPLPSPYAFFVEPDDADQVLAPDGIHAAVPGVLLSPVPSGSAVAAAATAGVWRDIDGEDRPGSGPYTAGCDEL